MFEVRGGRNVSLFLWFVKKIIYLHKYYVGLQSSLLINKHLVQESQKWLSFFLHKSLVVCNRCVTFE